MGVILGLDPRTQRKTRRAERDSLLGPRVEPEDDGGRGRRVTAEIKTTPSRMLRSMQCCAAGPGPINGSAIGWIPVLRRTAARCTRARDGGGGNG